MKRIIKLSEQQIKETTESGFEYLSDNDIPHNTGNTEITADGRLNDEEFGKPVTTDKISKTYSPQYSLFNGVTYKQLKEDIKNRDNFYNSEVMDVLSNGKEEDNLTRIPESVDEKLNQLIEIIKTNNLNPKQEAMVLNKIIENISGDKIPIIWRRELIMKLNKK